MTAENFWCYLRFAENNTFRTNRSPPNPSLKLKLYVDTLRPNFGAPLLTVWVLRAFYSMNLEMFSEMFSRRGELCIKFLCL
jgi:hypothetical protein